MKKNKIILKIINLLLTCVFVCGCSTYELYRSYDLVGDKDLISMQDYAIKFSIDFNFELQTDFYSIGLFGLPVIPIYINIIENKELELQGVLEMEKDYDFFYEYF